MFTIPNLLSVVRLALVPILLWLAWNGDLRIYVLGLGVSLLTDLLDGFLARRLRQATELGAKLDSWADFITTLSLPVCVWWLRPEIFRSEAPYVCVALAGYLIPVAAGFLKYKRLTSYHTWAGKAAALVIGPGVLLLLAADLKWAFEFAAAVTFLAGMEELAMTLVLPEWRANVPSLRHALHLNRQTKK